MAKLTESASKDRVLASIFRFAISNVYSTFLAESLKFTFATLFRNEKLPPLPVGSRLRQISEISLSRRECMLNSIGRIASPSFSSLED